MSPPMPPPETRKGADPPPFIRAMDQTSISRKTEPDLRRPENLSWLEAKCALPNEKPAGKPPAAFVASHRSPKSRGCRPRDSGRSLCLWQRHRQSAFLSFPRDNGGKNRYVSFAIEIHLCTPRGPTRRGKAPSGPLEGDQAGRCQLATTSRWE